MALWLCERISIKNEDAKDPSVAPQLVKSFVLKLYFCNMGVYFVARGKSINATQV
jgi:hypothetical protein